MLKQNFANYVRNLYLVFNAGTKQGTFHDLLKESEAFKRMYLKL